jgi:hypothetical protein
MSDAINDAMNLLLPALQSAHATIIQKANQMPVPPALFKEVRKLGGNLSLSITHKQPESSSYMQQIAWDISNPNEMCLLAVLAAELLPKGKLAMVVHNAVSGVQLWIKDGQDALCIHPFEFGLPASGMGKAAGK